MARYEFTTNGNYIDYYDGIVKICSLHNTSRCVSWRYDATGGLIFKVDDFDYQTDDISNISFDGVACSTQADFVSGIETAFPSYAGGSSLVSEPGGDSITALWSGTQEEYDLLTPSASVLYFIHA